MSDRGGNEMSDTGETRFVDCRHLRTKKMYIPAEYPQTGRLSPSRTGHYWCVRTAREFGPDGKRVSLDGCGPERDCCER